MNVILKISLRNLVRQKRRNLLLGTGIAFGMCLLVMANSLGAGISDMILNKMVTSFSGHIFVRMFERDEKKWNIIRDKNRIKQVIVDNIDGVKTIREKIAVHGKALGNGKSLYISVIGIEPEEAFYRENPVMAGNLVDLANPAIENPLALYERMAKKLNVGVNDVIHMRFESVYGQVQTTRFTVVAVMKAVNPFFNMLTYCHLNNLKPLVGYQDYETNCFQIILDHITDHQVAIEQANRLHEILDPDVAGYSGTVHAGISDREVTVLAVIPEEEARRRFASQFQLVDGSLEDAFKDETIVILSQKTANILNVRVGDEVTSTYITRFEGMSPSKRYWVGAIFQANDVIAPNMMFIHADQMYETVFQAPSQYPVNVPCESPLFPVLLKEWALLDRTVDQMTSEKKYRELGLTDWRGAILDVQTIHEVAGEVLEFEKAISLVTVVGVLILFFIIQIGVINTLRMTIRERTREIGTVRAIGMQRNDVRWCFVTEVLLLTLFACLAGIVLALLLMGLLSLISFDTGDSEMGFFLVNSHLYFVPRIDDLVQNLTIILDIALLTAYFPSRRAAQLSVVEALRHYE